MTRTIVYIDGFNLYYRLLRGPGRKWLDLAALCQAVLPATARLERVNYYTARISGRTDPTAPARQHAYLRALASLPLVHIHYGNFLANEKWAGLVQPPQFRPALTLPAGTAAEVAYVWKTEEKGSDVNLGVHLVRDAFKGAFEWEPASSPIRCSSPTGNGGETGELVATTRALGGTHQRASTCFANGGPRSMASTIGNTICDGDEIAGKVTAGFLRDAACYPGYPALERRHGIDLLPDQARVFAFLQVGQFRIECFLRGFRQRCPAEAAALDAIRAQSPERPALTLAPYLSEARLVLLLSDLRQLGEAAYRVEDDDRSEAAIRLAIGS